MRYQLGVDVGSCYVKVVEGCERNGRLFIENISHFPNPFPDIRNSLVERDQDAFVKTLREFLHKNGIRERNTISNLSNSGAVIHYFDIPKLPENEIEPAVNLEMMQVVPGGTKNLEYDYTLLPGKNGKKTVLFIGCQKERCEFFTSCLHRAGLKPLIMDHDSLAILNCFNFFNKKPVGVVFLLNIGHNTTNFALAEKNGFVLVRDIPYGGKSINESVAKEKGISKEDAQIYSSKQENASELRDIVIADLEDLLADVVTGMEYFKNRTGKSPETLFLTGGFSIVPGVTEAFEQRTKIKTLLWNPLEHIDAKTFLIPEHLKKKGSVFAVALGLVLRKIK
jgi:type IV pilus assembly protein PilM